VKQIPQPRSRDEELCPLAAGNRGTGFPSATLRASELAGEARARMPGRGRGREILRLAALAQDDYPCRIVRGEKGTGARGAPIPVVGL